MNYIKTYKELEKQSPNVISRKIRHSALNLLALKDRLLNWNNIVSQKAGVQILYFHHVYDDEILAFDLLLKYLAQSHTFVSYSEAVYRILNGDNSEPCIALSSDDGFQNNLVAAKIMDKYAAKACFFINPNSIGLSDPSLIADFCRNRLKVRPTKFLNWNEINDLQNSGHEIGAHTRDHINVAETPLRAFREDLEATRKIINSRCGNPRYFSFPFGRIAHFSKEAMAEVFKAGHDSCASAERGSHNCEKPVRKEKLLLRRDQIIAGWPLSHNLYFIRRNLKKLKQARNEWPA